MTLTRAVAVLAIAAGAALPAVASAEPVCVSPSEGQYPYACHDADYPGCVIYGSLGEEGMFHLGRCPWPWGSGR